MHVMGDLPVRPGVRRDAIERLHPALPSAPRPRLERRVAHHTGEPGVVDGSGLLLLLEEMGAGGGVGFARLLHARAHQALELLIGRHRVRPLVGPRVTRPPAATPRGDAKVASMPIRESAPLCVTRALAGEGPPRLGDRKSTRLNSSHLVISYAVFCLKKKNNAR